MALIGRHLNKKHKLGAQHALYRRDGKWFHHLKQFPGVLCDENGFILFQTEEDYKKHPGLQHAQDLHAPDGIASFPGYVRFPDKASTGKRSEEVRALKAKCEALEAENLRLHRKIAKLEAQLISARNGIMAHLENTPAEKLTKPQLANLAAKGPTKSHPV
ncbi:MAG TPA: hypothetical protein VNZ64_09165 [Candidatus Acidoferrum sp.]|jgi:hypothetical protein|nr:hypothetical protein [Candidatus Acidoferrum sp.]